MKKIFFVFLISYYGACFGQTTFEKKYALSGYHIRGNKVIQEEDGGFMILANASQGGSIGSGSIIKIDSIGNVLWAKLYSELNYDNIWFTNFEQTLNKEYLISGTARNANANRLLMMKVDSLGSIIWSNCYGQGLNQNAGWCVKVLSDGSYLLGGSRGLGDFYFVKTDITGNTLWAKTLGTGGFESITGIEITSNGNFVIMGTEDQFGTTIAEFDNNGSIIWNKTYELPNSIGLTQWAIRKCPDDGYAVVGVWIADTAGFFPYLLKTDSIGNVLWCKLYTQTTYPATVGEFFDLRITSDSGFILTWEPEFPCQYCRTGLIKTDGMGNIEWAKNYTLNEYTFPSSGIQTSDLGYAIVGNNYSSNPFCLHLVKTLVNGETDCYDSTLAVVPTNLPVTINTYGNLGTGYVLNTFNPFVTDISLNDSSSCLATALYESEIQNQIYEINIYPNPASQYITITAQNLKSKKAEIKITNMLGQILLSKEENTFGHGNLSSKINIESMVSGIYIVSVFAGENSIAKKLIVD